MKSVRFSTKDAELLYSFPKPSTDLRTIVWYFTSTNRTYPPSYEELASCLTKGLKAGIVRKDGDRFVLDDNWYARIHMADATAGNEIEAMLEFERGFVDIDFDEAVDTASTLTEAEYKSIVATLR